MLTAKSRRQLVHATAQGRGAATGTPRVAAARRAATGCALDRKARASAILAAASCASRAQRLRTSFFGALQVQTCAHRLRLSAKSPVLLRPPEGWCARRTCTYGLVSRPLSSSKLHSGTACAGSPPSNSGGSCTPRRRCRRAARRLRPSAASSEKDAPSGIKQMATPSCSSRLVSWLPGSPSAAAREQQSSSSVLQASHVIAPAATSTAAASASAQVADACQGASGCIHPQPGEGTTR